MQRGKGTTRPPASGKVVRLEDEKKRRASKKQKVLEPKLLFNNVGSEFNDIEVGPEDGHWYGPGTTDG